MLININLEKGAMDWVNVLKNPIHFGTPEWIQAAKTDNNLVNTLVDLTKGLSEYLTKLSIKMDCSKSEVFESIVEFYAFRGVTIQQAMEIIYFAMEIKEIYTHKNLTKRHILAAILYYHTKQNLNASEWHILTNKAQSKRGIKNKYSKNENSFNNN